MPAPRIPPSIVSRLPGWQEAVVSRMGLTDRMAVDVRREVQWWIYARMQAAENRRSLMRGVAVAWTAAGYAELLPVEVPRPGKGRATVLTEFSIVSPGTERARYLHLPNSSFGLGMPGYASSGVVIETTADTGLEVGTRVAVSGGAHQSLATAPARDLYAVPDGVSMVDAAMVRMAIISGYGVRRGDVGPGRRVAVIGAGVVGLLAQRLAAGRGAHVAAVVARSPARRELAYAGGAERFLIADLDVAELHEVGADVVLEATGSPDAIGAAVDACAPGGRIVLLGSPRGVTADFPLDAIRAKRLELVGAHINMAAVEGERDGVDVERELGEEYMAQLAGGRIAVSDMTGPAVDPREPGLFYRELASDSSVMAAYFDWTAMPRDERSARGHLIRIPPVLGRGVDMDSRPLPASTGAQQRLAEEAGFSNPFGEPRGHLRIGLVGCGDIAASNAAAAGAAPNTELVAAYDPAERLARDITERFGGSVAPSAEALMEDPNVDAVLLSVPHHLHRPLALEAIEAGKHVIVEKPLANDLASAVDIAVAAERAQVTLSVAFAYRYQPRALLARRLIERGALGPVGGCFIRSTLDRTPGYWLGGYSGRSMSDWRSSREKAGGGILIMNLTHYVDLFRSLTGLEAVQVRAGSTSIDHDFDVEDSISVSAEYDNGALGTITGATARGTQTEEVRLWGRDGHLGIEPAARLFTLRAIDDLRTSRWTGFPALPPVAGMRAIYLSRLASAIATGSAPDVTADDALAVQAFVEAAYRSAATGESVAPAELLAAARESVLAGGRA